MWHEPYKASCSQWLGLRSLGICPLDNFEHMNRCWFGLHIACAHYANIVNGLRVESASKYSQKCRSDELYRSEGRLNFVSRFSVKQSSTPHSHKTVEASRGLWTFPASWLSWHSCIARRSRAIKPYGYVMGFWGLLNLRHTHPRKKNVYCITVSLYHLDLWQFSKNDFFWFGLASGGSADTFSCYGTKCVGPRDCWVEI